MSILTVPGDATSSALSGASGALASVVDPIAAWINPGKKQVQERGADFPNGFIIVEYIKNVPQKNTIIALKGSMMPFQPFQWEGETRIIKEYYPGNPEPATQILGPKESDVTIKGRFKDKQFKDPSHYGTAYEFGKLVDNMRRRGNLVKFGLAGASSWWRYGFIQKVSFKMNKISWVEYEITFSVVGFKLPSNNKFGSPVKDSPSTVNKALIDAAAAFIATPIPNTMPRSIADVLNGLTSAVAANIALVTNFVQNILNTAQDIESSAFRALGLIKNARASLSAMRRQIGTIAYNFGAIGSSASAAGQGTSAYGNISFLSEIIAAIATLSASLVLLRQKYLALSQTIPDKRYRVQTGDTLQNISMKFYQSAEHWDVIYDHNKLQTTALTPGQTLEIPNL